MKDEIDHSIRIAELISKGRKGQLTEAEQHELDHWIAAEDRNSELFRQVNDRVVMDQIATGIDRFDEYTALERLKSKTRSINTRRITAFISAAAAIILVSLAYIFWKSSQVETYLTIKVPYGQLRHLTLPDSSSVWLNAGSTFMYPEDFGSSSRNVRLTDGQAFFDIKHDEHKPFFIHTNGADINVLGTAFEVKSYLSDKHTSVSVSNGKVGVIPVGPDDKAVMLLPQDHFVLNNLTGVYRTSKVDANDIASWREQKLTFIGESLAEVIQTLQRRYNVRITVERPALLNERITLSLENEHLETVLQALSFSNDFKYKMNNDGSVTIK